MIITGQGGRLAAGGWRSLVLASRTVTPPNCFCGHSGFLPRWGSSPTAGSCRPAIWASGKRPACRA